MGFFSNTKDAKKAIWLYEAHRCSKCGALNTSKQKLILQYRYDEIALSRSEVSRRIRADEKLEEAARKLTERAADPQDIEKYYDLNLLGRCKHCGNQEPWSRMRWRLFEPVFNALVAMSVIALIVGVAQLFMEGSLLMLLPAAGLIALTLGAWLLKKMRRKRREEAIARLKKEYIPFLTEDEADFREKVPEVGSEKLETVEPSGYYRILEE